MGEYIKLYGETVLALIAMLAVFCLSESLFITIYKYVENLLVNSLG